MAGSNDLGDLSSKVGEKLAAPCALVCVKPEGSVDAPVDDDGSLQGALFDLATLCGLAMCLQCFDGVADMKGREFELPSEFERKVCRHSLSA